MAIKIPPPSNGAASEAGVTPLPSGEGVATGGVVGLAVDTGETAATGCGVPLGVGLAVTVAVGPGVGVGAGVGCGVGGGVARVVGLGVAAAATTVIVPVICSGWIMQKYGYVPAVVNLCDQDSSGDKKGGGELNFPSGCWTVPEVIVWGSPGWIVHVTVSPTWIVLVDGANS